MGSMFSDRLAVLAHQGGWDEIALVGGPIVVIIVVLAIAKRRVDAQVASDDRADDDRADDGTQAIDDAAAPAGPDGD